VKFEAVRTLSDRDIATWVACTVANPSEGSRSDPPPAPTFPDDRQLGTPDGQSPYRVRFSLIVICINIGDRDRRFLRFKST
jgi:hypothetical protein